jgi:5-methylcytosine-specific restriction endonuclease McrA
MSLTPKNWHDFQHYKDRKPAWIKLHRGLLDNIDYHRLSSDAAKMLPLIWIIASERDDGVIPDIGELAFRLRIQDDIARDILTELRERDFLVEAEHAEHVATHAQKSKTLGQKVAESNGFGSRHISDVVRREVWARDGGVCINCGSNANIEYDHKTPVSKGGNSELDNIQLLCRPCNRSKRSGLLRMPSPLRSLEREREKEKKEEEEIEVEKKETRASALRPGWPADYREQFWSAYPNKIGKADALRKLEKAAKAGKVDFAPLMEALARYANKTDDRPFCNPATWINQERWTDQPRAGPPRKPTLVEATDSLLAKMRMFDEPAPRICDGTGENTLRRIPSK